MESTSQGGGAATTAGGGGADSAKVAEMEKQLAAASEKERATAEQITMLEHKLAKLESESKAMSLGLCPCGSD